MLYLTKALIFAASVAQEVRHVAFATDIEATVFATDAEPNNDPVWGCGLLGDVPGINEEGAITSKDTELLLDGLKKSSSFGKVSYWNYEYSVRIDGEPPRGKPQYLSKDFLFMPSEWGVNVVDEDKLVTAGTTGFKGLSSEGSKYKYDDGMEKISCPAEMADIFLGMNEPDIAGSCLGNMMGRCKGPCLQAEVEAGDCPQAKRYSTDDAAPNAQGRCDCWSASDATSVGFWSFPEQCPKNNLPAMFSDADCTNAIIAKWKASAVRLAEKGYKYLTTPQIAENMDWASNWIEKVCQCTNGECKCKDVECGCPSYVIVHFYGRDCKPEDDNGGRGGYSELQKKIDYTAKLMMKYSFLKGMIINEVGMLNCAGSTNDCIPNSGENPGDKQADKGCPNNGLATFMEKVMDMVIKAKTEDGRPVVKQLAWYNEDMVGGTYNLRLFDDTGKLNNLGKTYISSCSKWGEATKAAASGGGSSGSQSGGSDNTGLIVGIVTVILVLIVGGIMAAIHWKNKNRTRSQPLHGYVTEMN